MALYSYGMCAKKHVVVTNNTEYYNNVAIRFNYDAINFSSTADIGVHATGTK